MKTLTVVRDEAQRVEVLKQYGIDQAPADPAVDLLVQLAANIFNVPISLISLVESDRQLFAAGVGLAVCESSRDVSFCAHALGSSDILVIPDTLNDPRFRHNALVVGPPHVRFYAGCPLVAPTGHVIGTLCIVDTKPRIGLDEKEAANLRDLAALVLDKLELRRLDLARQASQSRFERMAEISPDAIVCTDEAAKVTFWNLAAERLLGYSAADMLGRSIDLVTPPGNVAEMLDIANNDASLARGRTLELNLRTAKGEHVPVEVSASMWREDGRASFCAILRDVTERRLNEARLFRLANIDPLTELPNRAFFRNQVESALGTEQHACVMMVDLDGFKDVNDSLGHPAGDSVLAWTAKRLAGCVRSADVVARMGGDEFAIFLPGMDQVARAGAVASEIIESVSQPIAVEGASVTISASVGIALFPANGVSVQELLSNADLALYEAKAQGKQGWQCFTPDLRIAAAEKRAYQAEFARALQNGEFELHYQPQVDLQTGDLVGAEALLRWQHPEKGLLPYAAFMTALETSPLAGRIGTWVLTTACAQAVEWREAIPAFRIGVNVLGAQFRTGDLAQKVLACLAETGLPAGALELEIVERTILRQDDHQFVELSTLRDAGVSIAFDDYGTGNASLLTLKHFPLSRLKMDKSFVRGMLEDKADAAIIRVMLFLGRSLDIAVTADGVDTEAQRARLAQKGCEQAQGALFGLPMPASAFSQRFIADITSAVV